MKRICKKINQVVTIICVVSMLLSMLSIGTYALDDSANNDNSSEMVELMPANIVAEKTEDGYEITMDLIREADEEESKSRALGWITEGVASFRLTLYPDNGYADVDWTMTLIDDYVKAVSGTFILEKDIFGPINPNYDKVDVDEYYLSAQYHTARGSVGMDFWERDYSQNIIFRWETFVVTGVMDDYYVLPNDVQGEVQDFI